MLDLGWTLALTPSVKLAYDCIYEIYFHYSLQEILSNCILYLPLIWVLLLWQIFMYSKKQGSIASKWIFKNFNSWGRSVQCTHWAVISNNNPMVGTIKKFLMNWEFNSQQFQQISIKIFSFFWQDLLRIIVSWPSVVGTM
jgi:hypothetical protein